jgi:hypothetical protein
MLLTDPRFTCRHPHIQNSAFSAKYSGTYLPKNCLQGFYVQSSLYEQVQMDELNLSIV